MFQTNFMFTVKSIYLTILLHSCHYCSDICHSDKTTFLWQQILPVKAASVEHHFCIDTIKAPSSKIMVRVQEQVTYSRTSSRQKMWDWGCMIELLTAKFLSRMVCHEAKQYFVLIFCLVLFKIEQWSVLYAAQYRFRLIV